MNELQKFIIENKDYEEKLSQPPYSLKIKTKVDKYGRKYSIFMYNTIKSDWDNPIVRLSRGAILREDGEYICRPYDKFFNSHETRADKIDMSSAFKEEKLDGSIIKMYYHEGEWRFATNGMILAEDAMVNETMSFMNLIKLTPQYSKLLFLRDTNMLHTDMTYIFELTSLYNKVVIEYNFPKLTLLDIRHKRTGEYIDKYDFSKADTWTKKVLLLLPTPMRFKLDDEYLSVEGFVIKDANGNMVKVKNAWYVSAHHMKGENINKSIVDVWLSNEGDEFLAYFPEMKEKYNAVHNFMATQYSKITSVINTIRLTKFNSRKDLAMFVKESGNYSIIWKFIGKDLEVLDIEDEEDDKIRQFLYGKFKNEIITLLDDVR